MNDESATALHRLLRAEIDASGGVIPFARFMELALYAPGLGYYERSTRPVGRAGDFYTSVSVGPVFGELLAFQFARWLDALRPVGPDGRLHLVEAGAHDGRLGADLLGWLRTWRPDLFPRLELWLVEPSPTRRGWQTELLAEFAPQVRWASTLTELRHCTGGIRGILYANELLDAFPVHRWSWNAAESIWQELGVTCRGSEFAWQPLPRSDSKALCHAPEFLTALPPELLAVLTDSFATEVSPAATAWWREAAASLAEGFLVTFDYGLVEEDFLKPERRNGTLRAYCRHQPAHDVLSEPGGQDLTAHVNFTALESAGRAAGLNTIALTSQRRWLTDVFATTTAADTGFPPWDATRVRQFQTLTHPEHLGRAFQVLVQGRPAGETANLR